ILNLVLEKAFDILPQSDPECCSACGKTCYQMTIDILQGKAKREDCVLDNHNSISISIGGKPLTIVPFVQNLFRDTIIAMISNLKGVNPSQDIEIRIKGKDD
ncbi:MAG: molybdopterin-guanine dinucleotide biosynthesis protein MobB, partial [Candidatus Syntrophosphaera sp.]|nr:molybdopterin-guanine dinucleotide biosynthesis protein MobB [Candidatus Syntrophosphaera sp.]